MGRSERKQKNIKTTLPLGERVVDLSPSTLYHLSSILHLTIPLLLSSLTFSRLALSILFFSLFLFCPLLTSSFSPHLLFLRSLSALSPQRFYSTSTSIGYVYTTFLFYFLLLYTAIPCICIRRLPVGIPRALALATPSPECAVREWEGRRVM